MQAVTDTNERRSASRSSVRPRGTASAQYLLLPMLFILAAAPLRAEDAVEIVPSSWDVGLVTEGAEFRREISIRPVSGDCVTIERAWAPCGDCLTAGIRRASGTRDDPAVIDVVLNTKGLIGGFSKKILISTSRPKGIHRFVVSGRTYRELDGPLHVEVFFSREDPEGVRVREYVARLAGGKTRPDVTVGFLPLEDLDNYRLLRRREDALKIERFPNAACFVNAKVFLGGEDEIRSGLPAILFPADSAPERGPGETSRDASPGRPGVLQMVLFYASHCRGCEKVFRHLEGIRQNFAGAVHFRSLDVNRDDNDLLAMAAFDVYGISKPAGMVLLVGDKYLSGRADILDGAEGLVRAQIAAGGGHLQVVQPSKAIRIDRLASTMSIVAISAAGLVDGINPCAFATMVLFVAILASFQSTRREILLTGMSFCAGVFIAYYLIGLAIFRGLAALNAYRTAGAVLHWMVLCLAIVFGVLSLLDAFRHRAAGGASSLLLKVPSSIRERFAGIIRRRLGSGWIVAGAFFAGLIIAVLEGICTGQMYIPVIAHMAGTPGLRIQGYLYLLLYNALFMVPLLAILLISLDGIHFRAVNAFMVRHIPLAKVLLAGVFFGLAGIMLWLG